MGDRRNTALVVICLAVTVVAVIVTAFIARRRADKRKGQEANFAAEGERGEGGDMAAEPGGGKGGGEDVAADGKSALGDLDVSGWAVTEKELEDKLEEGNGVANSQKVQPNIAWTADGLTGLSDIQLLVKCVAQIYENEYNDLQVSVTGIGISEEEFGAFDQPCYCYVDAYGYLYLNLKLLIQDRSAGMETLKYVTCKLGYEGEDLKIFETVEHGKE